jgi:hypothetical protein
MTEMVTSGSMSGDARRSDGLLGESGHERRRSQQAPPVLYATARVLDSTSRVASLVSERHLRERALRFGGLIQTSAGIVAGAGGPAENRSG